MRLMPALFALIVAAPVTAQAPTDAAQKEAREILAEMVSMNTSVKRGDVTPLAEKLAARFRKAGIPAADVQVIGPEAKDKNLVVRIKGKGTAKPVLFLSHLDVVDAMRADWSLEPYALTEQKDGWLYGRGTSDDKGPAATLVAGVLALARSKVLPDRDIILALTSGEENGTEPGAAWLIKNRKSLVDADWVFNFDAGGPKIDHGKLAWIDVQGSEKVYFTVALSAHNPGGHSSLPRPDNAIYQLVNALRGLQALTFPIHVTDVARAQLTARAQFVPATEAALIKSVLAEPLDSNFAFRLARSSAPYNSLLRTTCVPTMLAGGHAENALPALATVTVNCRLIPGENATDIMTAIRQAVNDTGIAVTEVTAAKPSPPSPLAPGRLALIKAASKAAWGKEIPISPEQQNGATDGLFFRNAGIPVYGVTGIAAPVDEARNHGRDERIMAKSFKEGVAFATALVREVAGGKVAPKKK